MGGNQDTTVCLIDGRRRIQSGRVCDRCRDQIIEWLNDIVDLFALLDDVVERGGGDDAPKVSGSREAPLPGRTDVMNLRGPSNPGDSVTDLHGDQTGPLPTLEDLWSWERVVRLERRLGAREEARTVASCSTFLRRHLPWILDDSGWDGDLLDAFNTQIRGAWRALKDVCGEYAPKPIGRCPNLLADGAPCMAPLFAPLYTPDVSCRACGASWSSEQWLLLGGALETV